MDTLVVGFEIQDFFDDSKDVMVCGTVLDRRASGCFYVSKVGQGLMSKVSATHNLVTCACIGKS